MPIQSDQNDDNINFDQSDTGVFKSIKIVDQSYFEKEYKAKEALHQQCVESTMEEFNMNNEQERAFRIIANHAQSKGSPQLKVEWAEQESQG